MLSSVSIILNCLTLQQHENYIRWQNQQTEQNKERNQDHWFRNERKRRHDSASIRDSETTTCESLDFWDDQPDVKRPMLQAPTGVKPYGERVKLSLIMIKNDERNEIVWGKNSLGEFEFYFFTQVTHVSSQTITRRD